MVENQITKRLTGAALAALLLLFACVPVPTNLQALDRVRYQKAYAGPEAVILGSTPAAVLTLMGMAGVYVACHTDGEWLENSVELASDFAQFVNENGYANEYNCDLSQYVDSTGQNIDVQAAYDGGFYDMLQAYLQSQNAQAILGSGDISNAVAGPRGFELNGLLFPTCAAVPFANQIVNHNSLNRYIGQGYQVVGYKMGDTTASGSQWVYYQLAKPDANGNVNVALDVSGGETIARLVGDIRYIQIPFDMNNAGQMSQSASGNTGACDRWYQDGRGLIISETANIALNNELATIGQGATPFAGVFNPENVAARLSDIANGAMSKVRIFEPTAEQIEAGYDYETIMQNELAGINTGIEGLDAILNSILAVLAPLAALASAPFSWLQSWWNSLTGWWAELLEWIRTTPLARFCVGVTTWLGDTPFGNIAATVIDGVQAIPGAIAGAGQAVLEGVQAIPGAISGTLEGILEGVQSIPATIEGAFAGVLSGVNAISGVLADVMSFFYGGMSFESLPVVAPPNWSSELQADLADKVPFCYVIRAYNAIGGMFGNFSSNRSFYLEMEIPEAGVVTMDGEQVLGLSIGALDIATTIRIMFTSLLCFGLLYRSYKIIERTANSL